MCCERFGKEMPQHWRRRFSPWRGLPIQAQPDPLGQELARVADRFWLDRHVQTPAEDISTDAIIRILDSAKPPRDEIRRQYMRRLLLNALSERDWAAGARVAEELENDAELESAFSDIFDEMLEDQPDSVYVFIRNRLMHLGIDEQWIPRLQNGGAKLA